MAAAGVEEDPAVLAARILLSLRDRKLVRYPEWVSRESVAEAEARYPPEGWPKRRRSGQRMPSDWRAALALPKLGLVVSAGSGSGACSSWDDREPSLAPPPLPRWRERPRAAGSARDELVSAAARRQDSPVYYVAPAGSGPSTSAADRAAPRAQHRPGHSVEKASVAAKAASPPKEFRPASSPETPLDFGASGAGSGASSSWDDAARPASKRRAPGSRGYGGASSGDEGCSSPDKRARVDGGGQEKAISEPNTQSEPSANESVKFAFDLNDTNESVKFAFDLNEPWTDGFSDNF